MHYHDLGAHYNTFAHFVKQTMSAKVSKWSLSNIKKLPKLDKDGSIDEVLKKKDNILVQVSKEPISTKFSYVADFLPCLPDVGDHQRN